MPKTTKHLKGFQFKKGQSGNPEGSRLHNPIKRALKDLTLESYQDVIRVVCTGNMDALKAMAHDLNISALQVGIAATLVKAITTGDVEVIERLVSRLVGKIPDEINLISKNLNVNATLDEGKLRAALAKLKDEV